MKVSLLKTGFSLLLFLFVKTEVQAQHNYWSQIAEQNIPLKGKRQIVPQKYLSLRLSTLAFKEQLFSAPHESKAQASNQLVVLLPLPNGHFQRFSVLEAPIIMEPLASNYPDMKTFSVRGIDDPRATGKLDWTEFGFHGMVRSPRGDFFIDPYCLGNTEDYISYYTADFRKAPEHMLPESGPEPDPEPETDAGRNACRIAGLRCGPAPGLTSIRADMHGKQDIRQTSIRFCTVVRAVSALPFSA